MIILGLNVFHAESSACIIKNGQIVASCEEERFSYIKNFAGFPLNSIQYCLDQVGLNSINDVDFISINSNPKYNFKEKIIFAFTRIFSINFIPRFFFLLKKKHNIYSVIKRNLKIDYKKKINYVPHHRSHVSLAFLSSGMDEAIGFTFDAAGDFSTAEAYLCNSNEIKLLKKVIFPHSLGIFYQAMTQYVGFKHYGEEYKFMGLAAYGKPNYVEQVRKIANYDEKNLFKLNLKYFRHQKIGFSFNFETATPFYENLYSSELENLLGPALSSPEEIGKRQMDVASSTQAVFEEIVIKILNHLYDKYEIGNLVMSGGCSFNSCLNGKILENTKFKKIFIPSNCGDAGGALGSALDTVYHLDKKNFKNIYINNTYLGPAYSNNEIENRLIKHLDPTLFKNLKINKIDKDYDLYNYVTNQLTQNKVIAWFQNRMEFGPRALGNRSILADPRNPNMKEIINLKIKKREKFRPFAPSILEEKMEDFFKDNISVPFMNQVLKVRNDKKELVPAIVHVDGTARVHTVSKELNEKYYGLIENFYKKTGIPILLNTSLNINGPICEKPEDAFECFVKSDLDILTIGNWVLEKK